MPGPRSRTRSSPSLSSTSTRPSDGLHLTAFSSRFADCPLEPARDAVDGRRLEARVEPDPVGASARPVDRRRDHLLQLHPLGLHVLGSREVEQVAEQLGQLLRLAADLREDPRALVLGQRRSPLEDLDVRPQAGQRRAKLVRGVCDQLRLRAQRVVERAEHRVEAVRQPAELILARRFDPLAEVACCGDVLRGLGQAGGPARRPCARRAVRGVPRARSRPQRWR